MLTALNTSMHGTLIMTEMNAESSICKDHFLAERTSTINKLPSVSGEAGILLKRRHKIRMPDTNIGTLHFSGISINYNEIRKRNKNSEDWERDSTMVYQIAQ